MIRFVRTTKHRAPAMGDGDPSVHVERVHSATIQFAGDLKDDERVSRSAAVGAGDPAVWKH